MNSKRDVSFKSRAWHRLTVAILGSVVAASTLLPTGAWAVPPQPPDILVGDDPPLPETVPSCTAAAWSSPVVKIHLAGFSGVRADMEDAIRDVNAQIAEVGGSSVRIESTITTTDPYHFTPYNDHAPVIHVGFQSIADPAVLAVTLNRWPCEHFITVDRDLTWNYGTPAVGYYNTGKFDPSNNVYFRISYQHELLHALGVGNDADGHPNNVYSFLNYGDRPWAHAPVDEMIRPLPYDVRELRRLYPAPGTRTELAVLNTWMVQEQSAVACAPNFDKVTDFDPELLGICENDPTENVTQQKMLCAPSVGDVSKGDKAFARYCGEPNATAVCPGSVVQVHYALANYSTAELAVTSNVWFSIDDVWDVDDWMSPTTRTYSVGEASAQNKFGGYTVPSVPPGFAGPRTYYVIVRATATSPSGVTARDSIPMRGTVTSGPECLTAVPAVVNTTRPVTLP